MSTCMRVSACKPAGPKASKSSPQHRFPKVQRNKVLVRLQEAEHNVGTLRCPWGRRSMKKASLVALVVLVGSFNLSAAPQTNPKPGGEHVRTYYVAADELEWNYAPEGVDHMTGKPLQGTPGYTRRA